MNSSKTANLLMVSHNYEKQNKKILLIKPEIDDRFDNCLIQSRTGITKNADLIINDKYNFLENGFYYNEYNAILVDEVNFLTSEQIDQLRIVSCYTPVICYGLRTDYKSNLFPASKRLMEIADSIEEIKTVCHFCDKKAIINMKYSSDGQIIREGSNDIELGLEEKYLGCCWQCWYYKRNI
jgi:thymidine kinase